MDNIENATTNSQVMQLQQLIAGPLVSTIEADALSSRRYYDMLQLIAFEDANEGDTTVKRLRMLKFSYLETNADGSRTNSFDYGKGRIDKGSPSASPFRLRASLAPRGGSGSLSGKSEQQLSANMKVHIKMRQADVPAGLSNMLRLTASNLQVEDAEPTKKTE